MRKTLDLGSGPIPKNPFNVEEVFGIDIVDFNNKNIKIADLSIDKIPFEDSTFDFISGFDFLEHIPRVLYLGRERKQPFIDIMSEVWRVLKPNGEAIFYTPGYPKNQTFDDPQHVNYISEGTLQYFCLPSPLTNNWSQLELCQSYGFRGTFEVINYGWDPNNQYHLVWHLRAIK